MRNGFWIIFFAASGCSSQFESDVQKAVAYGMKDPASAQFRDVDYYPDAKLACGEVNGNNSYGGKAGFGGFAYDNGYVVFESDSGYVTGREKCTDQIHKQTEAILKMLPEDRRKALEKEFEEDRKKYGG
jgi:hypothetical protein